MTFSPRNFHKFFPKFFRNSSIQMSSINTRVSKSRVSKSRLSKLEYRNVEYQNSSIEMSSIKTRVSKSRVSKSRVSKSRVSKLEYRKVEYRKVEIRKQRINKVSDASYISDVVIPQISMRWCHPVKTVTVEGRSQGKPTAGKLPRTLGRSSKRPAVGETFNATVWFTGIESSSTFFSAVNQA